MKRKIFTSLLIIALLFVGVSGQLAGPERYYSGRGERNE
jgi:PBP1b-binding outer membrane lipoprotein LpoB